KSGEVEKIAFSMDDVVALPEGGVRAVHAAKPGSITFRVSAANVITQMHIWGQWGGQTDPKDSTRISVSRDNGLHWKEIHWSGNLNAGGADIRLGNDVAGAYEALVRIELLAASNPTGLTLRSFEIETTTALNSKTQ